MRQTLAKLLWVVKTRIARIPGAYALFRWATKRIGQGRIYEIRGGPMKGLKWRRDNRLPYWYHVGLWEPHLSELMLEHLAPGGVFWDVGANAGYHTLLACRIVGPTGRVIAFEPDPHVAAMLEDQLALNGLTNYELVRAAVTNKSGTVTLMRKPNNLMSTLEGITDEGEPLEVPGVTLDEMSRVHPPPNLIKMDIEGAETLALPGGDRLLRDGSRRPLILLSVHGEEVQRFCEGFLRDRAYAWTVTEGFEQMLVALPVAEGAV